MAVALSHDISPGIWPWHCHMISHLVYGRGTVSPADELPPPFKGSQKVGRGRVEHVLLTWGGRRHGDVVVVEHGPFPGLKRKQTTSESRGCVTTVCVTNRIEYS